MVKEHFIYPKLRPKKSFGQNFMKDEGVNAKIALTIKELSKGNSLKIVEIGGGTGSLTRPLVSIAKEVHVIERDRDLIPILNKNFTKEIAENKVIIHEADAKKFALETVFINEKGFLAGNIPYHLTSSFLLYALKYRDLLHGAIFLVQKEVAVRLLSEPNNKSYGLLTVVLGLAFKIEKILEVKREAFWPIPKVDSTVIALIPKANEISLKEDFDDFFKFVKGIFQKRRKKLSTILSPLISKENFFELGIDPNLRPENLYPKDFLHLYNFIKNS